MEQKKRSYEKWTDDEVQALWSVFAQEEIQRDFELATPNDRVYGRIADKLAELNIGHTPKHIREKLKKPISNEMKRVQLKIQEEKEKEKKIYAKMFAS